MDFLGFEKSTSVFGCQPFLAIVLKSGILYARD